MESSGYLGIREDSFCWTWCSTDTLDVGLILTFCDFGETGSYCMFPCDVLQLHSCTFCKLQVSSASLICLEQWTAGRRRRFSTPGLEWAPEPGSAASTDIMTEVMFMSEPHLFVVSTKHYTWKILTGTLDLYLQQLFCTGGGFICTKYKSYIK